MWILVVTVAIGALIVILYMLSPLISPTRIKLRGAHVLITGGSLGIGKSIAVEVAKRGANVTLLARNQARLMEAKTEVENNFEDPKTQKVLCVSADVSKDYAVIEKVVAQAEEKLGPVDMLVNCAGISVNGKFEDIPIEEFQRLISVNYLGAVYTTRAVVRGMKARKRGRIVLVSSQAGQLGVFGYSAHSPTKFALRGLAECLQMELKPYNIRVTLSFPPDTDTPGFIEENITKIRETKIISETSGLFQPDYVARNLVNDMVRGNFFSYVGLDGYMLASLTCGMSPVTSIMEAAQQVLTVGLFRAISLFYLENFDRIIQRCKDEDDMKAAVQADSSKSNVKSS